jgi:hypothetical protein
MYFYAVIDINVLVFAFLKSALIPFGIIDYLSAKLDTLHAVRQVHK